MTDTAITDSALTDTPRETQHTVPTEATEAAGALLEHALFEVKRVVVGQDQMIERIFVSWLARGHVLLEGAPGLAKTLAAKSVARILGGSFARLQFTPDLMPSDLVGTRIYRPSREEFDIELGPVFANVVLVDEINRAPATLQSALLEVMGEHQISSELSSVYDEIQTRVGYHLVDQEILRWFVGVGVIALLAAAAASMVWSARFL